MKQTNEQSRFIIWSLLLVIILLFQTTNFISAQQTRQLERQPTNARTESRTALVIGNGAYTDSPLRNPVNDATDVAAALRSLGFTVILQTDLNQTAMKRTIRSFGENLRTSGGVGLFYYAGHGVQSKGINYLIPVGSTVNTEEEVEYEGVDVGLVLAQMESAKNKMNIVILDACRNNPFARSMRSADKGLASIDAPSGTLLAYSTAPGSVASDGTGRNGLYTQELLKQMKTSELSIEDVFKRVRVSVRGATGDKQTPWESSSLTGDFYFLGSRAANSGVKTTTNSPPINSIKTPSAEEVLTEYSKAIGFEKYDSIKTLVQKGIFEGESNGQKFKVQVEYYLMKPDKIASLFKSGNSLIAKEIYAGDYGWIYDPKNGSKKATDTQVEFNKRNFAVTSGDLGLIKQFYSKITVRGVEKIDGREVYVLDATKLDGIKEIIYIDTNSSLLFRWDFAYSSVSTQKGISFLTKLYVDEYIGINGVQIPMTIRQTSPEGTTTIKFDMAETHYNVPLDDALFKKP